MAKIRIPKSGPDRTAAGLIQAMSGESGSRVIKFREQLEALGKSAVPALEKSLAASQNPEIRSESARALGNIGDPSSVKALILALEDKEQIVGRIAAESLAAFGDNGIRAVLRAFLRAPNSPGLRFGTRHILRRRLREGQGGGYGAVLVALENGVTREAAAVAALAALKIRS